MALPRSSRWLLASGLGHALVVALLVALPAPPAAPSPDRALRVTELAIEPPAPTPPAPVEAAPIPPSHPVVPLSHPVVPPSHPVVPPSHPVASAPPAVASAPPAVASAPPAVASAPPPAAPPVLRASDLLRPRVDALSMPTRTAAETPAAPSRAGYFPGSVGTAEERARGATQGFVREALDATVVREAPGVRGYLWNVRRRVAEAWRPGVVRVPNLADTLMAGFIAPEQAIRIFGDRMIRRQRQVLEAAAQPRVGGAADAIEAIGGVSGNGLNANRPSMATSAGDESWRRNVRTTRAEVQVDQDEAGRVLDVRLLHPSGIPGFDRAAIEAVRRGLDEQDPMPLPGGRRSRWSFTVVATRRLFTPSVGGAFDESRGWFRIEVPGQVTLRSRVQMESSAPRPTAATP